MKFLLAACNAKYIHSNLAVHSLRAYAREYAEDILVREYTINQQMDDVLRDVYDTGAEVLLFSCYIWNISYIKELLENLAKILPNAKFWVGGPEVSYDAEDFLRENPWVTGVMTGEGEETFLELVRYYEGREESGTCQAVSAGTGKCRKGAGTLADIAGIVWREEAPAVREFPPDERTPNFRTISPNRWPAVRELLPEDKTGSGLIHHNCPRDALDLSSIPFPWEESQDFSNRIVYYESSRGCPFSCSYCLSSVDRRLRFRRIDLTEKELQFFLDKKVPQVKFVDRTFNCREDHAMAVWTYLRDHDNGVTNFHFEISADLLTERELELMRTMRPGLIQLEIGVQSVNPRTLQAIHRSADLEKLKENVARIRSFGNIHQHLDLIAGLPYEDYESFRRSFCEVYAMEPQQLQLGFLKVLKGSRMFEEAGRYGIIWKGKAPYEVLTTKWLNYDHVLKLKMVESMVEAYYNSGQFTHTLKGLLPYFADPFDFYEQLGDFYLRRGYSEISHSRIRRYEILREFALARGGISMERLTEDMLFDLYLREKLKSRPSFAPLERNRERALWEYRRKNQIPKTAHIELFSGGRAVLFDYEHRDPLTNNAAASEIRLEEES